MTVNSWSSVVTVEMGLVVWRADATLGAMTLAASAVAVMTGVGASTAVLVFIVLMEVVVAVAAVVVVVVLREDSTAVASVLGPVS